MRITVFTPTYNRAYIIENLYRSLQRQTCKDFEWIVIDDGSTDDTEDLFKTFLSEENSFPIRYTKVENGGKHRAINRGVKMAEGELFLIVDSDDYLTDDALEVIDRIEKTIPAEQKHKFCGVCGQRGHDLDNALGLSFSGEVLDITILDRPKHGIWGDKSEVFYTEVLKKYPFPEFDGENFITECVVWDRIGADGYKLRFFNQILIICEYLPDGLTKQGAMLFKRNPKGQGLNLYQARVFGKLKGKKKWQEYLEYYYILRDEHSFGEIADNLQINAVYLGIVLFSLRVYNKVLSVLH